MRRTIYILTIFILLCGIALAAYAPDVISIAFVVAMIALIAMGILFGILCAVKRGKFADQIITFVMTVIMGMPEEAYA